MRGAFAPVVVLALVIAGCTDTPEPSPSSDTLSPSTGVVSFDDAGSGHETPPDPGTGSSSATQGPDDRTASRTAPPDTDVVVIPTLPGGAPLTDDADLTYALHRDSWPTLNTTYTLRPATVEDAYGQLHDGVVLDVVSDFDGRTFLSTRMGLDRCMVPLWSGSGSGYGYGYGYGYVWFQPVSQLMNLPPFLWRPDVPLPDVPAPEAGRADASDYASSTFGTTEIVYGQGPHGVQVGFRYGSWTSIYWTLENGTAGTVPGWYDRGAAHHSLVTMRSEGKPVGGCDGLRSPERGWEVPLGTPWGPADDVPTAWPLSQAVARAHAQPDLFHLQALRTQHPDTYLLEASFETDPGGGPLDPSMSWTMMFAGPASTEAVIVVCGVNENTRDVPVPACSEQPHELAMTAQVVDWDTQPMASAVRSFDRFTQTFGQEPCLFSVTSRAVVGTHTWSCIDPSSGALQSLTVDGTTAAATMARGVDWMTQAP